MWFSILSGLLSQNQNANAQRGAELDTLRNDQRQLLNNSAQQQQAMLDIEKLNQNKNTSSNPILDDIMKKYGAGRYSR